MRGLTLLAWTLNDSLTRNLLLFMGLGLVLAWWMARRSRSATPAMEAKLTPPEQIERGRQEQAMKKDLAELSGEIETLTRRFATQLDEKSDRLERLIKEANQTLMRFERLASKPTESAPGVEPPPQPIEQPTPQATAEAPPVEPLARQVYGLADAGMGNMEIARRLREHVGKVELILALREA